MKRFRSVLGCAMGGALLAAGMIGPRPLMAQPWDPRTSPCHVDASNLVLPNVLLEGEAASIQLRVKLSCPEETSALHIVLLLDASSSMAGEPNESLKDAAELILDGLNLPEDSSTQVGIVTFNTVARTLCRLMGDLDQLRRCVGRVGASGGNAMERGFVEAARVFKHGRNKLPPLVTADDVLILVSDGKNDRGCEVAKAAARRVKDQGVLMISLGASQHADGQCLRQLASSGRYSFESGKIRDLVNIFAKIGTQISTIHIRQLQLLHILPSNMALIDGTVDPPADVSADSTTLRWDLKSLPREGVTITLGVRPLQVGYHLTAVESGGTYVDQRNRPGSVRFTVPIVTVLGSSASREAPVQALIR